MSYCKQEGKDKIIFLTKEDHEKPSEILVSEDNIFDDTAQGAILPNGQINWECPCLGGMASGPCGTEFREAFSCFHFSTATEKGSDCLHEFRDFSECIARYPEVYKLDDEEEEEDQDDINPDISTDQSADKSMEEKSLEAPELSNSDTSK